ncbi:MAG: UDP-N-acetylmuramate--L-alanine ligase, partial [Clostridia bacterium]|nr:UDP-N-acetylmuramate--L-alanine ligase [Clostridia bacterium]
QTSPTLLAGARSVKSNSAFRIGEGDTLVCEACEYNRSFLDIKPTVAVILNIEKEHTDTYPKLSNAEDAYIEFAKSSTYCVLNYDCSSCRRIGKRLQAYGVKIKYFSMYNENTDAYCSNYKITTGRASFDIIMKTHIVQDIKLSVVGSHNAANALASALAASLCNASAASIQDALSGFKGIKRRFEYVGSVKGADVYDDYAHHPTEIKATLKAASTLGYERIFCAFQPHTYSRTSEFFSEFASAFDCCDEVIFSDIYAAREKNIYGVSSKALAASAKNGIYIKDFSEIQKYLFEKAKKGTLIITMGAGRMNEVAYALTENGFQGKD